MKGIITTLFLSFACISLAQTWHPSCDGNRYKDIIFDEVSSVEAIQYGEGSTIGDNFKELKMDIYFPTNDEIENRPVIMLAFGGSFIGGNRQQLAWLCEEYAKRGFVAVTIDYRLYDLPLFPLPEADDMQDVVMKTISDMKAAIRFLREDAAAENTYNIDPELIFVGGVSAGAITALHTAILDETDEVTDILQEIIDANGGLEGNTSDNYQYPTTVSGVVNFSGALADASFIDENDPPVVSIHDEFDPTVPYNEGFASIFGIEIIYMEGSGLIQHYNDSLSVKSELWTIEGSDGHVSFFGLSGETTEGVIDFTAQFLYDIICEGFVSSNTDIEPNLFSLYPNPTTGLVNIQTNLQTFQMSILDMQGSVLETFTNETSIDLTRFTNGSYIVSLFDQEKGKRGYKKLVIQH